VRPCGPIDFACDRRGPRGSRSNTQSCRDWLGNETGDRLVRPHSLHPSSRNRLSLLAPKSRTIKDAHDDEIQSDVLWMGHSGENNFKRTIILKVAAARQQRTAAISNAFGMITRNEKRGGSPMFAKHWLPGLLALLLAACAAPQLARAQVVQQYAVVYIELAPGSQAAGERILDQLATVAFTAGALRFDVDKEVQRSNFYVLIETWPDQATFTAFKSSSITQALLTQLAQLQIAPLDERDGTLIQAGKAADAPAHGGEIEVVTHIDVIPSFLTQAEPLIRRFVADSASDPGVREFLLVSWDDINNHFQLIERYATMRAFDQHVSAQHSVAFRNALQPFIGAPYDERLYTVHP
jgi:quinol monooxygenase YgiN